MQVAGATSDSKAESSHAAAVEDNDTAMGDAAETKVGTTPPNTKLNIRVKYVSEAQRKGIARARIPVHLLVQLPALELASIYEVFS